MLKDIKGQDIEMTDIKYAQAISPTLNGGVKMTVNISVPTIYEETMNSRLLLPLLLPFVRISMSW